MSIKLKGIIPPVITPLKDYKTLDTEGLSLHLEHLINGGVHGLFLLGTNGEAPSLGLPLKKELIKKSCEQVDKRIPVLVGVTSTSYAESVELAEYAGKHGADAIVIMSPYYYPVEQEEIIKYVDGLASECKLPFVYYNIPSHTKFHTNLNTMREIKKLGAIAIKDSSGDMFFLYSLIEEFKDSPDFSILTGTELYLPETIHNGGHGAVAGGANIFPNLFVSLYDACIKGDTSRVDFLREVVLKLYNTIYTVGKYPARITAGTKCALSLMGICNDYMAPPLSRLDQEEKKEIEGYLDNFTELHY